MLVITMFLLIVNCLMYAGNAMSNFDFFINILNYLIPTFILPIAIALIVLILEKKPIRPMIKGLLCYPLFMGTWIVINIKCLFKRETSWQKIDHVRDIKILEVKE